MSCEKMGRLVLGRELGKKLAEAGLIPDGTRRFVIDVQPDDAIKVYYDTYGDDELMDKVLDSLLTGKPLVQEVKPQAVDVTSLSDEYRRHAVAIKEANL